VFLLGRHKAGRCGRHCFSSLPSPIPLFLRRQDLRYGYTLWTCSYDTGFLGRGTPSTQPKSCQTVFFDGNSVSTRGFAYFFLIGEPSRVQIPMIGVFHTAQSLHLRATLLLPNRNRIRFSSPFLFTKTVAEDKFSLFPPLCRYLIFPENEVKLIQSPGYPPSHFKFITPSLCLPTA